MKIGLIVGSHRSESTSEYILKLVAQKFDSRDTLLCYAAASDTDSLSLIIASSDAIVIAAPVYCGNLPSPVIKMMEEYEKYRKINGIKSSAKVYAITNSAFFEASVTSLPLEMIKNWCKKCELVYCGGIGVSTGLLLNVGRKMTEKEQKTLTYNLVSTVRKMLTYDGLRTSGETFGNKLNVLCGHIKELSDAGEMHCHPAFPNNRVVNNNLYNLAFFTKFIMAGNFSFFEKRQLNKSGKTLLICDFSRDKLPKNIVNAEDYTIFDIDNLKEIDYCTACGMCAFEKERVCPHRGKYNYPAGYLAKAKKLIVISKLSYGGFSADTKRFFDKIYAFASPMLITLPNGKSTRATFYKNKYESIFIFYDYDSEFENTNKKISTEAALQIKTQSLKIKTIPGFPAEEIMKTILNES